MALRSSFVFRHSSFVEERQPLSVNTPVSGNAQDLFSYAQFQQQRGNLQEAMGIYSQLGESSFVFRHSSFVGEPSRTTNDERRMTAAIPENIRRQAQTATDAIAGQGGFTAARVEYLADTFMEQVFDPAALGAMAGAGLTYRVARFGLLGSAGRLGLQSRLVRPAASLLAFGAEASLFPIYGRLGNMALARQVDWSSDQLIHDIQGSFLVLGGLKLFGAMGTQSLRWWQQGGRIGGSLAQQVLPTLVPQTAMCLGILSGHQGEQWLGLKEATSTGQLLSESMATLIHFNAMGRLIPILGGPRVRQLEQGLEQETRRMSGPGSGGGGNRWLNEFRTGLQQLTEAPLYATTGVRTKSSPLPRGDGSGVRGPRSQILMMEDNGGESLDIDIEINTYTPEVSQGVRDHGAQYLGKFLRDQGDILWFLPVEQTRAFEIEMGETLPMAITGHEFREGIRDQVIINTVYGGRDGNDPVRIDYVFELSELQQKGFLIPAGEGRYRVNPDKRYVYLIPDRYLDPDLAGPSREEVRQRARTFLVSEAEAGDPSTPPPPAPQIAEAIYFPHLPFSQAGRLSAYPFQFKQEARTIRSMNLGPVVEGGEPLVWIELGETVREAEGRDSLPGGPQYLFLSVEEAQRLELIELDPQEFEIHPRKSEIYVEFSPTAQSSRTFGSRIISRALDRLQSEEVRRQGHFASRQSSLESKPESVYLLATELADRLGVGRRFESDFEIIRVIERERDQPEQVVLQLNENPNHQRGQAMLFFQLTLPTEVAVELLLIRKNRSGDWTAHPERRPIIFVAESDLQPDPNRAETQPMPDLPVQVAREFHSGLVVLPHNSDLSGLNPDLYQRIPIARFKQHRLSLSPGGDSPSLSVTVFRFYLPEDHPHLPILPVLARGFTLSAQDALDLRLVFPGEKGGFELNSEADHVFLVRE